MSQNRNNTNNAIVNSVEYIVVSFPMWSISDGNYHPFRRGQKVSFAINVKEAKIRKSIKEKCYLKQRKFAEYSFCARVIGNFSQEGMDGHFLVLDTGMYKFFMHHYSAKFSYLEGEFVVGKGKLEVDYFIWHEESYKIKNAPDINCDFVIGKIQYVNFPIKFITADEEVIISYSSLSSPELEYEIIDIEDMSNEEEMDEEYEVLSNRDDVNMIINPSFTIFHLKEVDF